MLRALSGYLSYDRDFFTSSFSSSLESNEGAGGGVSMGKGFLDASYDGMGSGWGPDTSSPLRQGEGFSGSMGNFWAGFDNDRIKDNDTKLKLPVKNEKPPEVPMNWNSMGPTSIPDQSSGLEDILQQFYNNNNNAFRNWNRP